jgi:uncharacterized protein YkwD
VPLKFALPCLVLAALLAGCQGFVPPPPAPVADRPLDPAAFDGALLSQVIFRRVNQVRESFGLPALAPNRELDAAADEQAAHLVLIAGVEHTNFVPGEETPRARVARVGMFPALVGENALMMPAVGPPGSPSSSFSYASFATLLVDGWMNSPGHRANILDRDFQLSGVASRIGLGPRASSLLVYAVQVFTAPEAPTHGDSRHST